MATNNTIWQQLLKPNKGNAAIWMNALLMLVGLFALNWSAASILTAYFFETIIIGLIHIVKLLTVLWVGRAQREHPAPQQAAVFNSIFGVLFFMVHYFLFVFVQSVFMFSFLEQALPGVNNAFNVVGNYGHLLQQPDTQQAVALILVTNIVLALRNFFLPQKYHTYRMAYLFFQPYLRIVIQQVVVLLAGFFILLNAATAAAILLVLVRLVVDLVLYGSFANTQNREAVIDRLTVKQDGDTKTKTKKLLEYFFRD